MIIAPIASAFEHCAGMVMPEDTSGKPGLVMVMSADEFSPMHHDNLSDSQQVDMDCHASSSCTLHVCGGCGIISSEAVFHLPSSATYSYHDFLPHYQTTLDLDLRPPISIL